MAQGIELDRGIIEKAKNDFGHTSTSITGLIRQLENDVNGLVGSAQQFNGAQRIAFDQNRMLLREKIDKATHELMVIGQKFGEVQNQHSQFSQDQAVRLNQAAAPSSGGIVSGLNC